MGNPTRLLILWFLAEQKRTIEEIAEVIDTSVVTATHHLRILAFHNLVETRHEPDGTYYRIPDNELTLGCRGLSSRPSELLTQVNSSKPVEKRRIYNVY